MDGSADRNAPVRQAWDTAPQGELQPRELSESELDNIAGGPPIAVQPVNLRGGAYYI